MVYQYFVHILSLVTDSKPSGILEKEENGCRNYLMIDLQQSYGTQSGMNFQPSGPAVNTYLQSDTLPTLLQGQATLIFSSYVGFDPASTAYP